YKEQKDENSTQWYNLIAARSDWEKSEHAAAIKKIIEAYHTDEVKNVIEEPSDGMDEPVGYKVNRLRTGQNCSALYL
ncbi:MetQ/NlpA family ABC transporter substrate-binding protein, partial [Streptococcus suis]